MKQPLFRMVIVSTIIISTLNSCSKNDSLPDQNTNGITQSQPSTLNLTAYHWEEVNGIFVSEFKNVISLGNASHSVKVYVVTDGNPTQINQPVLFLNGSLWATNTQTDVGIYYRGNLNFRYLNIKVVID